MRERIVAGNWKGHVRNGPARNTVQFPSTKYREYHEKREYPRFDTVRSNNDIVFPSERESSIEPSTNSLQNDFSKSEPDVWQKENMAFFPKVIAQNTPDIDLTRSLFNNKHIYILFQETDDRRISRFRFPSSFTLLATNDGR